MSTCDFTVTLSPTQQPLTIKTETGQCCTINVMNDVDITESSANGTVLVWDAEFNLWVRKLLDASQVVNLSAYIANYLSSSSDITIGGLTVTNDINVTGNLSVDGDIILKGDTINLGDGGDVINLNATVNNHFIATTNNTFNLGSTTNYWNNLYISNTYIDNTLIVNDITINANSTANYFTVDKDLVFNVFGGGGIVFNANVYFEGDTINFGDVNSVINLNATVNNHIYPTTTNIYNLGSSSARWNTLYAIDIDLTGNLSVDGDIILKGSTITLGDGGDVININASVNNNIVPTTDSSFDLGTSVVRWRNVYADNFYGDATNLTNIIISKSQTGDAPASLANGQIHYSYETNKLYIGQTDASGSPVSVEYIGGKLIVDKVANLESIVASLSSGGATLANTIITGILTLSSYPENAALRTKAGGVVEAITGSSGEVFQVAANGTPYFDDLNGGTY